MYGKYTYLAYGLEPVFRPNHNVIVTGIADDISPTKQAVIEQLTKKRLEEEARLRRFASAVLETKSNHNRLIMAQLFVYFWATASGKRPKYKAWCNREDLL